MFKHIIISLSVLLAVFNSGHADIDAYGNFYSTTTQTLTYGQPVAFESQNDTKKIQISDDRTTITLKHKGAYLITYNGVGYRSEDDYSIWGLALTLNGNPINGSSVNVNPNDEILMITGQVIVQLKKNDQIRLINNTHDDTNNLAITLEGGNDDISASIVLVNLED